MDDANDQGASLLLQEPSIPTVVYMTVEIAKIVVAPTCIAAVYHTAAAVVELVSARETMISINATARLSPTSTKPRMSFHNRSN